MDYVFGTKGGAEVLKTVGDAHTGLTGYHQLEREYPDQTITDSFRVVRKLRSAEDAEGRCYDWYEIDHHYPTRPALWQNRRQRLLRRWKTPCVSRTRRPMSA